MGKTRRKTAARTLVCRIDHCLACKSCEIACALAHSDAQDLLEAVQAEPKPQSRVKVVAAGGHALPLQCRHCEDAPCLMVCPTEAIHRTGDAGPVLIDEERCIGCKMCLVVCPFGAIDLARSGRAVVKCDLCIKRTEAGQEPACVVACPTRALKLVDIEEYNRLRREAAAQRIQAEAEAETRK